MPKTIGNFADLAKATEEAAELDDAQPTSQFRNCSQLIGEALHYTKVAAGHAADILRSQRVEAAKAGSRPSGHGAWAGFTPTTGSGASSSGYHAVPSAARRARSAGLAAEGPWPRQRPEPAKATKRSDSKGHYRLEARFHHD